MSDEDIADEDVKLSTEEMKPLSSADSDRSLSAGYSSLTVKSETAEGDGARPSSRKRRRQPSDAADDQSKGNGSSRHSDHYRSSDSRRERSNHPRIRAPSPDSRGDSRRSRRRYEQDRSEDDRRDHQRRRSRDDDGEQFTLFFTKKYIFSNHYPCPVLLIDDRSFACTEQYYMFAKARIFQDQEIAEAIMQTSNAKEMKTLGSKVKNFNQDTWNEPGRLAMTLANYRKYQQNPEFRHELFLTHGTTLVECNPTDRRWGIGLAMNDPAALQRSRWRGENWLGQILTKIRDRLWSDPLYAEEVRKVKSELKARERRESSFR